MGRKSTLTIITIPVLMITAIAVFNHIIAENSQTGAKIYVSPSIIEEQNKAPPFNFYINISVYNVINMTYCEFNLNYTPGLLTVFLVESCKVQGQYPSQKVDANSELGCIHVELTYKNPINLPNASASVFRIAFTALSYGSTPLDLNNTILKNVNGDTIEHEVDDGFVRIIKHDIALIDCITSTTETYEGRIVNITVTVKNEGDVAENVTVNVYVNENLITTLEVVNLEASEVRSLTFSWNTTGFTPSLTPYQIKAEAIPVPYETNIANNVYLDGEVKIKLVGDVNGDGTVDLEDLTLWDLAFNTRPGDENWNPQADINGDEIVNKEDGILIIQNYKSSLS